MPTLDDRAIDTRATRKNFIAALLLHALVLGGLLGSAWIFHKTGDKWGDKADVAGAVQATMVNSIPLPPRVQPKTDNVLASETPSPVPPPPTPKAEPPPKPTDIPVVVKQTKPVQKPADKPTPEPPKHPQPVPPQPDKAASGETAGLRVAMTAVENRAGTSSTNVSDSAFGQRYAYYVRALTQKVAQQWYTQTLDSGAPGHRVTISFRVERDGSPSQIVIAKPSGDNTLDASAVRALQRIDTFGPLPDTYSGSYINVQYYFEPKQQ
jgi:protein TonB